MGWERLRRIGGGPCRPTKTSSPPTAKGHLRAHLRTPRQNNWGMEETKSPETRRTYLAALFRDGPPDRWRGRG